MTRTALHDAPPLAVCIDLDDTLIPNAYLYQLANWRCGEIVQRAVAPYPMLAQDILNAEESLDLEHAKAYRFNVRRFQLSWVAAYAQVAAKHGIPVDRATQRTLWFAAGEFRNGPFAPYPKALDTLRTLKRARYRLTLITAGDRRLQEKKILQSGVARFFDEIHVVDHDKTAVLADVVRRYPMRTVMVGDSKRSDMTPALAVGAIPVWLARGAQWSYMQANVDDGALYRIDHFRELPRVLSTIVRTIG